MVAALLDHRRRVETEVCPLFFRLGENDTLASLCADASFEVLHKRRIATTLEYADADEACRARSSGAPSRSRGRASTTTSAARVRRCYIEALEPWKRERGYQVPGEFVIVKAAA
jgi:hypothetical protein